MNEGIGDWVHRRRVKSAGTAALVHRDREITYDVLAARIDALVGALAARGLHRGDRVAYLGNNHPAFLEVLFATTSLGAVFVPLNTRLAPGELAYQLDDSGVAGFVFARDLETSALAALARAGGQPWTIELLDDPSAVPAAGAEEYERVLAEGDAVHLGIDVRLEEPAMIIYTSGTTGRPKGAVLTHGNITWNTINVLVDYDITSSERALMVAPLFHVAALGMGCFSTLLKGGSVVLEERFEPGAALAAIERHRVTLVSGVPTTFQMMCEHPDWATTDLSTLRNLTCGGQAVPSRVLAAYEQRGLSFSQGYGMTETSPGATSLSPRYSRSRAGSVGLPHFFTDVRIAAEDGTRLPPLSDGEIQIQGPNAITEYWADAGASAELYTPDGWLRSGDIGHVDGDGFLVIADRAKDMIISGGENIYPAEVEQVIMQLDEVAAVAVVGRPDERWGEVPHAVVVLRSGARLDEERLRRHLRANLAGYKVPKTWSVVEDLPRTATGKVRKQLLRE